MNGKAGETVSPYLNAEIVLEAMKRDLQAEVVAPEDHGRAPLTWIHDPAYVDFLEQAWSEWVAAFGDEGEAIPLASVHPHFRRHLGGGLCLRPGRLERGGAGRGGRGSRLCARPSRRASRGL